MVKKAYVLMGSAMTMVKIAISGSSQMSPGFSRRCEIPRRPRPASSQPTAMKATQRSGCSTQANR